MNWKIRPLCIVLALVSYLGHSQAIGREMLVQKANSKAISTLPFLREFLSIPNNGKKSSDIHSNRLWCKKQFRSRGFSVHEIPTSTAPLLLASYQQNENTKNVLIYLQVDGQPVDAKKWNQESPYIPVMKQPLANGAWKIMDWDLVEGFNDEWRIFARSASDAKGPIVMFLAALDAMGELGRKIPYNLKVIMDFEEELGSPSLPLAVEGNKELLMADLLLIFDGPRHVTNRPTLLFGARGIATLGLTVYGPSTPQHSGHFGNYAPNPALRLADLLASMKDGKGRVVLPGFYKGIALDKKTKAQLRRIPDREDMIKKSLTLGSVDHVGESYQEALQYPSLNITGMQSGWIGKQARTIVPDRAVAELDIRLVKESNAQYLIGLVKKHIEDRGFQLTDKEPTPSERLRYKKIARFNYDISYGAFKTDIDSEVGRWLQQSLRTVFSDHIIAIPMTGGSIPIAPFINSLDIPAVIVPTVNSDNNQHSPNENLRLGNYREGILTIMSILNHKIPE